MTPDLRVLPRLAPAVMCERWPVTWRCAAPGRAHGYCSTQPVTGRGSAAGSGVRVFRQTARLGGVRYPSVPSAWTTSMDMSDQRCPSPSKPTTLPPLRPRVEGRGRSADEAPDALRTVHDGSDDSRPERCRRPAARVKVPIGTPACPDCKELRPRRSRRHRRPGLTTTCPSDHRRVRRDVGGPLTSTVCCPCPGASYRLA